MYVCTYRFRRAPVIVFYVVPGSNTKALNSMINSLVEQCGRMSSEEISSFRCPLPSVFIAYCATSSRLETSECLIMNLTCALLVDLRQRRKAGFCLLYLLYLFCLFWQLPTPNAIPPRSSQSVQYNHDNLLAVRESDWPIISRQSPRASRPRMRAPGDASAVEMGMGMVLSRSLLR